MGFTTINSVKLRGANKQTHTPANKSTNAITGARSRANIMRVLRQNMAPLKYAYNDCLREKTGINGKIIVKWAIDEFGKVLFCKVINSTMSDSTFEQLLTVKIKQWAFGKGVTLSSNLVNYCVEFRGK